MHSVETQTQRPKRDGHEDLARPVWSYRSMTIFAAICFVVLLVTPVAVLPSVAHHLARPLGDRGCLPDGTFVFPGTTSLWNASQFLSINLPTTPRDAPWSFAHAKAVDIVWDLLVGRGVQVILVWMAFHAFSKALLRIMEDEEIPFSTYGAVGFTTGSFSSFFNLVAALKAPSGEPGQEFTDDKAEEPGKRSARARAVLLTAAIVTLYIAAVPSFFSSMSGYYSPSYPSLFYYPSGTSASNLFVEGSLAELACNTDPKGMMPAWGYVLDAFRAHSLPDYRVFSYPPDDWIINYFSTYQHAYEQMATDPACKDANSTADCPATNISSVSDGIPISAPLLNIRLLAPFTTTSPIIFYVPSLDHMPEAWACGNGLFYHRDFFIEWEPGVNVANITGKCTGGTDYLWGFSFLMLILVCVLNIITAIGLFMLWVYGSRYSSGSRRGTECLNTIRVAVDIAAQARRYYGESAVDGTWNSHDMDQKIYRGKRGMRMDVSGKEPRVTRRRWRTTEQEVEDSLLDRDVMS